MKYRRKYTFIVTADDRADQTRRARDQRWPADRRAENAAKVWRLRRLEDLTFREIRDRMRKEGVRLSLNTIGKMIRLPDARRRATS